MDENGSSPNYYNENKFSRGEQDRRCGNFAWLRYNQKFFAGVQPIDQLNV